jgi:hypothetical protein
MKQNRKYSTDRDDGGHDMVSSEGSSFSEVPAMGAGLTGEEDDLANKPSRYLRENRLYRRSGESWVRAATCLCFEVNGPEPPLQGWRVGPLPVRLPNGRQADREARATYFNARAADSLYGPLDGSFSSRWHRIDEKWPEDAGSVQGIELLRFPRYASAPESDSRGQGRGDQTIRYLAVIHLSLPSDNMLSEVAAAVRVDPQDSAGAARRELYVELIGNAFEIPSYVRRTLSVAMLTWKGELGLPEGAPAQWTPTTSWLWCAASATPLQNFCPDTDDPHLLDGVVYLSASWRALVLRDGVGFLGLKADTQADSGKFLDWGETYVRSLYTDVVLLAALERDALDDFAYRLAQIGNRFEKSIEFRSLVNEVTEFRNIFWGERVTRHGIANDILRRLHDAHRTPQVFSRVISDLDAFRQQVEAQALEISLALQVAEERRSRKFDHAASIAAIAFGLPLIIFSALALPIRGLTSEGHEISGWVVITIALVSVTLGAMAGAIGGRWLAGRKV